MGLSSILHAWQQVFMFALAFGIVLSCRGVAATELGSHEAKVRNEADSAATIVVAAQEAMAQANSDLLRNPRRNNRSGGGGTNTDSSAFGYTIPENVAQAASSLTQASSMLSGEAEDFGSIVDGLMQRFKVNTNDTNRIAQMLLQDTSAIMAGTIATGYGHELPGTDPHLVLGGISDNSSSSPLVRRQNGTMRDPIASSASKQPYWMETMIHNSGAAEYKSFRNVKDYGAKGDGMTDDTAAIQEAIADGRRADAGNGTGLTTKSATVYLPSGTYLVSGPLVVLAGTELVGNPQMLPTIAAVPSFVGLALLTYTSETASENESSPIQRQSRSLRNLVVDVRAAPVAAHVVGVHWQASPGSSIENVRFYMTNSTGEATDTNTQIGLYVENGHGGFLGDLYFVGGRYGALFGTQQLAASGLYFSGAQTALQMLWDWGWSLQNIIILDCGTGIDIVNVPDISGAKGGNGTTAHVNGTWKARTSRNNESEAGAYNGSSSSGTTMGCFSLVDMHFANTKHAISASLSPSNLSRSLVVLNSVFDDVNTVIYNSAPGAEKVLLAGVSGSTSIKSWGYGKVYAADGSSTIASGEELPVLERDKSLTTTMTTGAPQPFFLQVSFYPTKFSHCKMS